MIKNKVKDYIILIGISIVALLLFSISTSPLYKGFYIDDSAIFISIARSLLDGKILFKDIFDHKGPVLFGIQVIGQIISEGRNGMFLIQIISLITSMIFIYKTLNLIGKNRKNISAILLGLVFFIFTMEEGNSSEELSLPLIAICFYLFFKWIKSNDWKEKIPVFNTIIYGMFFAIITMMKLTNAIGIAALILGITVILLKEKKYNEILKHGFYFLLSVGVIFIPICFYFYKNNALNDMIYTTFTHNFMYIKNATEQGMLINKILYCVPGIIATIGAVLYRKENKEISLIMIIVNIISMLFLCIGRGLQHYYLVLVPNIIIGIYMIFEEVKFDLSKFEKIIIIFSCVILAIAFLYHKIWYNVLLLNNLEDLKYTKLNKILENKKENTAMICCPAEAYMFANVIPNYKYSFTQDNSIMSNKEIEKEIINDIKNKKLDCIVVGKEYFEIDVMKDVKESLESNYNKKESYKQKIINLRGNSWVIEFVEIMVYEPK